MGQAARLRVSGAGSCTDLLRPRTAHAPLGGLQSQRAMSTTPFTGSEDAALPRERPQEVSVDLDEQLHLAKLRVEFVGEGSLPVHFRQWNVEQRLGSGGMGVVYLARHRELGRRVALKILTHRGGDAELSTARFIREAQALARVRHDNVLQIHQVDTTGERAVIELEYIEGPTLRAWQSQPGRNWRTIVAAYASVGDGLAALHEAQLLHRDIKPDNLLMGAGERVKIVDLGLAVAIRRANDEVDDGGDPTEDSALALQLTADGAIVGTHGYMAPEVIVGAEITEASDQFSLAVSLYEAVYGVRPFTGTSPKVLAEAIRSGTLTKARDKRRRPRWLSRVLGRALSFEPDRRYACVADFVRALRRGLWRRRLFGWGSVASVIIVGLPAAVWTFKPPPLDPCAGVGAEMIDVWSSDDRHELTESVGISKSPQAMRSLEVLVATLDARTAAWTDTRAQLCVVHTKHEQGDPSELSAEIDIDLRQRACLDHILSGIGALVAELRIAERDLARHYMGAAAAVEALPRCDDRRVLANWPLTVPNADADAALAGALAAEAAGHYPKAEALAREVVERSRDSDPLRHADALYRLGHILGMERRHALAFDTLDKARQAAFAIGHDELFCRAAAFQAKLSASVGHDAVQAARELGLARACVERVGARSPILHADLLEAAGLLAEVSGDFEGAILRHQEALELRRSYFGDEHPDTAKSLLNLANALAETEGPIRAEAARKRYQECLELRTRLFGENHPEVAVVLFDLGEFSRVMGEVEQARLYLRRALEVYSDAPGSHNLVRAKIHLALAAIDIEESKLANASEHLERARRYHTANSSESPRNVDIALRLHLDGLLALRLLDYRHAADALRRAATLYRRTAPDSDAALDCIANEIEADYGLKDFARIAALVRDEAKPLEAHVRSLEPRERGPLAWYIGEALLGQSENAGGVTYLKLALAAYEALDDSRRAAELRAQIEKHEP